MIRHALLFAAASLALAAPAFADDTLPGLTVKAGEHWVFKIRDGQPVDARQVGENDAPATGELKVDLDTRSGTIMIVSNNSGTSYNYRAFMLKKPGDKGQRTSVCTLLSGGPMAFEQWAQAIPVIRISDFTEAKGMSCA